MEKWSSVDVRWFDWAMSHFKDESDESKHHVGDCKPWFEDSDQVKNHHKHAPGHTKALISLKHPNKIDDIDEDVCTATETRKFQH